MDEGVGNDSKVGMLVALMDCLLTAVQMSGPRNSLNTPLIVKSAAYQGGLASISAGSFTLDDTFGPDMRFSIYYYDLNHVGNVIQLITPSGKVMESINMQEEDYDANIIFVNVAAAERGLWKYKVENRADSHQGIHIQITALPNIKRVISVSAWTSTNFNNNRRDKATSRLVLFSSASEGRSPIVNAHVTARFQRLGTNSTGGGFKPFIIDLFDNGVGG